MTPLAQHRHIYLTMSLFGFSFCLTLYWQNIAAADEYSVEICRSRLPLPKPGIPSVSSAVIVICQTVLWLLWLVMHLHLLIFCR